MNRTVPHKSRWAERRSTVVYGTFTLVLITFDLLTFLEYLCIFTFIYFALIIIRAVKHLWSGPPFREKRQHKRMWDNFSGCEIQNIKIRNHWFKWFNVGSLRRRPKAHLWNCLFIWQAWVSIWKLWGHLVVITKRDYMKTEKVSWVLDLQGHNIPSYLVEAGKRMHLKPFSQQTVLLEQEKNRCS